MKIRNSRVLVLSLALVFALLFSLSSAFAAPAEKAADTQFSYIGGGMDSTGMLRVVLPEGTALPVDVHMAIPKGNAISWAGEIMGDDPNGDVTAAYSLLETRGDFDIYIINVKQSLIAQLEFSGRPASGNTPDGNAEIILSYIPAIPTDKLTLAAEIPASAAALSQDVVPLGKGIMGQVYGKTIEAPAAGEPQSVSIQYASQGSAEGGRKTGNSGDNDAFIIVGILGALALVGGALVVFAQKRSKKAQATQAVNAAPVRKKVNMQSATPTKSAPKNVSPAPAVKKNNAKRNAGIITALVVVVGIAALIISASLNTSTTMIGNTYFREFAQGDPCEEANFALSDEALKDPKKSAEDLFDTMANADFEILSSTLDPDAKTLVVKYCGSKTNEEAINTLLQPSGMVTLNSVPIGMPLEAGNGVYDYYFTKINPCASTVFALTGDLGATPQDKLVKAASALRSVPSMTGMRYDANADTFEAGFCDEQTNDAALIAAFEAAGLSVEVKRPMVIFNQQAPAQEQPAQ